MWQKIRTTWQKMRAFLRETINGAKIGLLIGFALGYLIAKLNHIEPREDFSAAVLSYTELGVFYGAVCGSILKAVRLWRGWRQKRISP